MNILCKLFGHIMKADDPTRGIAAPRTCIRPGCGHKEPGTKWPRNTWPPKLKTR